MADKPYMFRGVASPNTTQVPDQYFDELLAICSGAEFKVLMYITRRTMGFKRPSDNISLSQLLHGITTRDGRVLDLGTGLSKPTLLSALRTLASIGVIVPERRRSSENGDQPTGYSLRFAEAGEPVATPVVKKVAQGGGQETFPRGVVKKSAPQQTGEQDTGGQQTVSSKFISSNRESTTTASPGIVENSTALHRPIHARADEPLPRSERIESLVNELSEQFGDAEHRRANCTQALRLLAAGLTESRLEALLYEARSIVRDELHRRGHLPDAKPIARPMAFYFAVLRDLLPTRADDHVADAQGTRREERR